MMMMMMMMMKMIPLFSLGVSVSHDFTSVLKICTHGSPVSTWTTVNYVVDDLILGLVSRAPCSDSVTWTSVISFFFLCSRYSKQTSLSRSLPNLPGRLQMGCNTKVKLLISELFRRGGGIQKGHFRFGTSFTKCKMAAKWIYLLKKESIFGRLISLQKILKIARKSVSGRPRSFGANTNMEALDSQHCYRALLTV